METKRKLYKSEIEDILKILHTQQKTHIDISTSIVNYSKNLLKKQLQDIIIYPQKIPELKDIIYKEYIKSIITPGEAVGVIAGQSIGEKQTQSTLNTFHKSGSGNRLVNVGVPRIEELLNTSHNQKVLNCKVFINSDATSLNEIRKKVKYKLVNINIVDVTKSYKIHINKEPEIWYESFYSIFGIPNNEIYKDCITLYIQMNILYEYKLSIRKVARIITDKYSDIYCIWSPTPIDYKNNIFQFDIFVKCDNIEVNETRYGNILIDDYKKIYLDEVVKPEIYNMKICGIDGIKEIYFNSDVNIIDTNGGKLSDIMALDFVDKTNTVSNNIWDIYETLGIEAVRQYMIEEFSSLMVGINPSHIMLLVDKMIYKGKISSVSRYSMRNEELCTLSKASFEETLDNLVKAAVFGHIDKTTGVSASIICGKTSNVGSGLCELVFDIDKLSLAPTT